MAKYLISEKALEYNARILRETGKASGARVLIALKAFATTAGLHCLRKYADGACASGLYEAKLAVEHVGGHIAVYAPAYTQNELDELLKIAHHIDFNSLPQWERFRECCLKHPRAVSGELEFGLRVNPGCSTGHTPLYDPCAPGSRLGVPLTDLSGANLAGISGLHMHTLCEQYSSDLTTTVQALEEQAAELLSSPHIHYLNLGGGHWITKPDYNREELVTLIRRLRERYAVDVFLEPGEAWCIHSGVLRAQVLDVFESMGYRHAILDVSVSAHMPDVLEMPYRPDVYCVANDEDNIHTKKQPSVHVTGERYSLAGKAGELAFTYRLAAPTCLAGDVLGDYSFPRTLSVGDTIVLDDMAHYTIVKSTHFNGVVHPDIYVQATDGTLKCVRRFGYNDFVNRLG